MSTPAPRRSRRHGRARRAALLACLLAALAPAAAARAETTWEVTGAGFGHGAGMSQWGAFGFAKHGSGWKQILGHFYKHTTIGRTKGRNVRVLLEAGPENVDFTGANSAPAAATSTRARHTPRSATGPGCGCARATARTSAGAATRFRRPGAARSV